MHCHTLCLSHVLCTRAHLHELFLNSESAALGCLFVETMPPRAIDLLSTSPGQASPSSEPSSTTTTTQGSSTEPPASRGSRTPSPSASTPRVSQSSTTEPSRATAGATILTTECLSGQPSSTPPPLCTSSSPPSSNTERSCRCGATHRLRDTLIILSTASQEERPSLPPQIATPARLRSTLPTTLTTMETSSVIFSSEPEIVSPSQAVSFLLF